MIKRTISIAAILLAFLGVAIVAAKARPLVTRPAAPETRDNARVNDAHGLASAENPRELLVLNNRRDLDEARNLRTLVETNRLLNLDGVDGRRGLVEVLDRRGLVEVLNLGGLADVRKDYDLLEAHVRPVMLRPHFVHNRRANLSQQFRDLPPNLLVDDLRTDALLDRGNVVNRVTVNNDHVTQLLTPVDDALMANTDLPRLDKEVELLAGERFLNLEAELLEQ